MTFIDKLEAAREAAQRPGETFHAGAEYENLLRIHADELIKAARERDEARATKDLHKERYEQVIETQVMPLRESIRVLTEELRETDDLLGEARDLLAEYRDIGDATSGYDGTLKQRVDIALGRNPE